MQFYLMDHVIEGTLENHLSREQWLLKQFSGKRFKRNEAAWVWARILDHKWHISERLGRDVGLKVAVLDFLENIHKPSNQVSRPFGRSRRFSFDSTECASMLA